MTVVQPDDGAGWIQARQRAIGRDHGSRRPRGWTLASRDRIHAGGLGLTQTPRCSKHYRPQQLPHCRDHHRPPHAGVLDGKHVGTIGGRGGVGKLLIYNIAINSYSKHSIVRVIC